MLLKHFYDIKLAQASYLIGCAQTGDAIVIDANRDIAQYLRAAEAEGLRVTHVTETHIHADFVSGSRELAQVAGAQLHLSKEGGPDWQYAFAQTDGARLIGEGDTLMVGNIRLDVLHTPGHTPEHLSFLVTDTPAAAGPMGLLTGDFVFVGDVGRPDLLEKAAGLAGTMEDSARALFRSLQRVRALPDHLQIWPGHGADSACGKALGAVPSSTLGYERLANWGLAATDEAAFAREVLDGQPEPPAYFAEMKRVNRGGPPPLGGFARPPKVEGAAAEELLRGRTLVVDIRPAAHFAAGHIPRTINIPLNKSFPTWAGSLVPYTREFVLLTGDSSGGAVDDAARDLAMIGHKARGYLGPDVLEGWTAAGRTLDTLLQISVGELAARIAAGTVTVVDVRKRSEWEAGHLPGVPNIPLSELVARAAELPDDAELVVHCQSGGRSAIAASVLRAKGRRNVSNLTGGFSAWRAAGNPVDRPAGSPR